MLMPRASEVRWYVCLLWLVVSSSSYGQIQTSTEPDTSVRSWAVVFDVGTNFTVRPFQNAGLAAQYNFSRSLAVRIGLSGGYEVSRLDVGGGFDDSDLKTGYYLLSTEFLAYARSNNKLAIFYGAGPIIGYDWKDYEGTAGVGSVLGAEWFANNRLSFHAEYGMAVTYRWYGQEGGILPLQPIYSESSEHVWSVSTTATRLGVSIHF